VRHPALIEPIVQAAPTMSRVAHAWRQRRVARDLPQFIRLFGSQIITLSVNYTQDVRLTDCQNGFRAIRREVAPRARFAGKDHDDRARRW